MKNILSKIITFCKTYKKRILIVIGSCLLVIIAAAGITCGVIYSRAKSNIKYSQSQLEKIALEKIPGTVVDVEKELNFRSESYQYEFKIKDKNDMLLEIKLDSKYGTISRFNDGKHNKQNKQDEQNKQNAQNSQNEYKNGRQNFRHGKH